MMLSYRKTTTNLYNSIYHHFSSFDLAAFSKQLAHLLKSGIPLLDALDLLQSKNKHPLQREMFVHIKTHIEKGSSIAQALSMYPVYFDTIFCQLVACGEQSGQLEKILLDISDKRKKISLFKKNVRQKLAYPTLVLALSFILLFIFILKIILIINVPYTIQVEYGCG